MKFGNRKLVLLIIAAILILTGVVPVMAETYGESAGTDSVRSLEEEASPEILRSDIDETQCGEFLYYSYNEASQTFKIRGKGDMWEYTRQLEGGHGIAQKFGTYRRSPYYDIQYYNGGTGSKYMYDAYSDYNKVGYNRYGIIEDNNDVVYYRSPWPNDIEIVELDFSGCPNLTRIGSFSFLTKENLKADVIIPDSVTIIGWKAFEDTAIKSVSFNDKLLIIDSSAFMNCKSLTGKLSFPDSLTLIGDFAFFGDTNLSGGLVIPANVSEIGDGAFCGDTGLDGRLEFQTGSKLEKIGKYAFCGCSFTGSLNIPSNVKEIGQKAFSTNEGITEVYIPSGIETIAEDAFENCTGIQKVVFGGSIGEWNSKGLGNVKGLNDSGIKIEFEGGDQITLTFNSCGGTPVASQSVSFGGLFTEPEAPKKDRCQFRGWYTEPDFGGKKWDFSVDKADRNITLYAAWYQESCLVEFNTLGGAYVVESQVVDYGGKAEKPADPYRAGSQFLGWYSDRTFNEEWDFDRGVYSDITLYAKWSGVEYQEGLSYYVISAIAGYGGDISPVDSVLVAEGADQEFAITPWDGFSIKSVSVDSVDAGSDGTYVFHNVTGDHTITALFTGSGGDDAGDDGRSFYVISANSLDGGSITPQGSVIVQKYRNITFGINPSEDYRVSNVTVDDESVGGVSEYTFKKVRADHSIEASFIPNDGSKYCWVVFNTDGAQEGVADMYLEPGSKIVRPRDPVKAGYVFKGWFKDQSYTLVWDFDKDTVNTPARGTWSIKDDRKTTLYAYFIPEDKSKSSVCLLSSTEKFGMWIETVIGQGCKQKLYIANSDGTKMNVKPEAARWQIRPFGSVDTGLEIDKYFDTKAISKGILKCKKKAPTGYTAVVIGHYNGATLHYIVTVVEKVGKMGYMDGSGKFRNSVVVSSLSDNRCDFGYGPQHFIEEDGKFIQYFTKKKVKLGTALYEQPDDSYWRAPGISEEEKIYYCSARIPKTAGVTTRMEKDTNSNKDKKLYFFSTNFSRKIKKYRIQYLSPDGSGNKFTLIVKKPR